MSNFFYRNLKKTYPSIASASGVWVEDTDGKRYLDGCSGAIVTNLGYGNAEVNEAINAQLSRAAFAHTSQFVSEDGLKLAERLCFMQADQFRRAEGSEARVYFTSGGSESVETALKMARAYFAEQGKTSRRFVISRKPSYHGSTFGALAVTGHPARRKPYEDLLPASGEGLFGKHVPAPYSYRCRCRSLNSCFSKECALAYAGEIEAAILELGIENVMAVIAEPIIGAALGAAVPGDAYWPAVREICTKYGVLLIADEVMTGLGRAGANFALDLWAVQADIIALGKGLAAGYLPLGAVMASAQVVSVFEQNSGIFEHGFTYSAHPVACAAGLAVLNYAEKEQLTTHVSRHEQDFFERLEKLKQFDIVGDIRGRGYLAAIELVQSKDKKQPFPAQTRIGVLVAQKARDAGLLVYPGAAFIDGALGDHVMVAPPFISSQAELELMHERLNMALQAVSDTVLVS